MPLATAQFGDNELKQLIIKQTDKTNSIQSIENLSIRIVLCKEKTNKVVEFAFRDYKKPWG